MVLQRKLAFGAVLEDRRVINTNWMKGWAPHTCNCKMPLAWDFGGQPCLEPAGEKVVSGPCALCTLLIETHVSGLDS
jgi:hypothetical protein